MTDQAPTRNLTTRRRYVRHTYGRNGNAQGTPIYDWDVVDADTGAVVIGTCGTRREARSLIDDIRNGDL